MRGGVGAAEDGEERDEVAAGVGGTDWAEVSRSSSNSMSSDESKEGRCGCGCCCW